MHFRLQALLQGRLPFAAGVAFCFWWSPRGTKYIICWGYAIYAIYIYIYIYIYPPIYTPLPNSRWLRYTALRYVRRAQRGAYMWWKGLNPIKMCSKWAQNTCLSIPSGPGSLLEKRVFDPFLTHFWSQNGPISRHFGILHGPKRVTTGSKWAKNTCLSIPNGLGSLLEKCVFDPFLTHFWSQNGPFSRHFGILHGPKRAPMGSKGPKNTCLSIPSGLGTTLKKFVFFAPGTPVDPPLAPEEEPAKGTTWCIHVVEGAKLGQNGLKMG